MDKVEVQPYINSGLDSINMGYLSNIYVLSVG